MVVTKSAIPSIALKVSNPRSRRFGNSPGPGLCCGGGRRGSGYVATGGRRDGPERVLRSLRRSRSCFLPSVPGQSYLNGQGGLTGPALCRLKLYSAEFLDWPRIGSSNTVSLHLRGRVRAACLPRQLPAYGVVSDLSDVCHPAFRG
jgi:hypothetical protein